MPPNASPISPLPAPASAGPSRPAWLHRGLRAVAMAMALGAAAGCTTTSIVLSVAGVATDTSISWEIAKHLHAKWTEGDPVPCMSLNSVQFALSQRCGPYREGTIRPADVLAHNMQQCPLTLAARNPALWQVVPELLDKGARADQCDASPLQALAQRNPCPDFSTASPEALAGLRRLADTDPRAVRHDVVRMLTCPAARDAGLDSVVAAWADRGVFSRDVGFGVLGAMHPDMLAQPLAARFERQGHTAAAALGPYDGTLPSGFEEALRTANTGALDWWINRAPQLANRVPPTRGGSPEWAPLARTLSPNFLADAGKQRELVEFLMSRGADPWKPIPGTPHTSVVGYARFLQSPLVALLDPPVRDAAPVPPPTRRLLANATP